MITLNNEWLNNLLKITASGILGLVLTACGGGGGGGDEDPDPDPGPIVIEKRTFSVLVSDLDLRRSVNDAEITVDLALAQSGTVDLTLEN